MMLILCTLLSVLFMLILSFILVRTNMIKLNFINIVYNTLGRDLSIMKIYIRTLLYMKSCFRRNHSVVDLFHKRVEEHPNQVCFVFEGEEWTYKEINDLSNKFARCFILQGYKKGDEVALFMENCPEYVSIWLGLAKIGVIIALINTYQKADSLAHSINIISVKGIIFGQSLLKPLQEAMPLFNDKIIIPYCYTRKPENKQIMESGFKSMNTLLDEVPSTPLDPTKFKANYSDTLFYNYTSGTTGYPKAAIIKHSRFMWFAVACHRALDIRNSDIIYNSLPLYHTTGGTLLLGGILIFGGKMILSKKFSARRFWKDVAENKVTVCQYIGEICRYLLNTPVVPEESQHNVRLFFGNGMKAHIWEQFQERFKIPKIIEIYGSTEGNITLFNIGKKVGALGSNSHIFPWLYPLSLVKVNLETGEYIRDQNGMYICCKPGEPGEIVGKIEKNNPWKAFDGYVNAAATEKKILRNCFRKGDMFYSSGDILFMDEYGYLSFLDRTGDTFRCKGENVSTTEVENVLSKVLNHSCCVAYGVQIPGFEGSFGMAAIQEELHKIDFNNLYKEVNERLPRFAIPIFLRIRNKIEITGTFKVRKVDLRNEGYNPEKIVDPLYFKAEKNETYIRLTKELYSAIINGNMRL